MTSKRKKDMGCKCLCWRHSLIEAHATQDPFQFPFQSVFLTTSFKEPVDIFSDDFVSSFHFILSFDAHPFHAMLNFIWHRLWVDSWWWWLKMENFSTSQTMQLNTWDTRWWVMSISLTIKNKLRVELNLQEDRGFWFSNKMRFRWREEDEEKTAKKGESKKWPYSSQGMKCCEKVKRSEPHSWFLAQTKIRIPLNRSGVKEKEREGKRKRLLEPDYVTNARIVMNVVGSRSSFSTCISFFQSLLLVFLLRVSFFPSCFFSVSCSHWTLKWFFLFTVPSPILAILANVFVILRFITNAVGLISFRISFSPSHFSSRDGRDRQTECLDNILDEVCRQKKARDTRVSLCFHSFVIRFHFFLCLSVCFQSNYTLIKLRRSIKVFILQLSL